MSATETMESVRFLLSKYKCADHMLLVPPTREREPSQRMRESVRHASLTQAERERARKLRERGLTFTEIARRFNRGVSTVHRAITGRKS